MKALILALMLAVATASAALVATLVVPVGQAMACSDSASC
jgi:hypothetical protein